MQKVRRIGALVAMATTAAGIAAITTAAPASAIGRGPQPVSTWLKKVPANVSSWVDIHWRTDRRICDVEVRVRGERGVKVDHLGFRRAGTLSRGDTLRAGRTDFTRVRVTPYRQTSGVSKLWATISYDECKFKSRTQTRTAVLALPVLRKTWPVGHGVPGGPGHGQHGLPGHGPGGDYKPGKGGPGHYVPNSGQGQPGMKPGPHHQGQKPGPHGQKPGPMGQKPGPMDQKPGPMDQKPAPVAPADQKPAPQDQMPAPADQKPAPQDQVPADQKPAPQDQKPNEPAANNPAPVEPAPGNTTATDPAASQPGEKPVKGDGDKGPKDGKGPKGDKGPNGGAFQGGDGDGKGDGPKARH
jgi:hypothetical protein